MAKTLDTRRQTKLEAEQEINGSIVHSERKVVLCVEMDVAHLMMIDRFNSTPSHESHFHPIVTEYKIYLQFLADEYSRWMK